MSSPFLLFAILTAATFGRAGVYGESEPGTGKQDTRQDYYEVADKRLRRLADSTVALFESESLTSKDGRTSFKPSHYGENQALCESEPFYKQPAGAICSGSLVASDIIMTAGHCVADGAGAVSLDACKKTRFVFGYALKKADDPVSSVPDGDVYGCREIVGGSNGSTESGDDWALVRLDRPVEGRLSLRVNPFGKVRRYAPLVVIGHPAGLPTKVAPHGTVRSVKSGSFEAALDAFAGNSGSPVFNAKTLLIEGILVSGEDDFVQKNGCRVAKVCGSDSCKGETVTKISRVLKSLATAHDKKNGEFFAEIDKVLLRLGIEPPRR